jgi:hypothetical protein
VLCKVAPAVDVKIYGLHHLLFSTEGMMFLLPLVLPPLMRNNAIDCLLQTSAVIMVYGDNGKFILAYSV